MAQSEHFSETEPYWLRFRATIKEEVARLRARDGRPADDVLAEALRLRTKADLIEKG